MSAREAERVWLDARKQLTEDLGEEISQLRIYRVSFTQDGVRKEARVGDKEPTGKTFVVVAIFVLAEAYALLCRPPRSRLGSLTLKVARDDVVELEKFDERA